MRRFDFFILLLFFFSAVYAEQYSAFDLTIGGAYSNIGWKSQVDIESKMPTLNVNLSNKGLFAVGGNFSYTWFFCRYVGIGVGAGIWRAGTNLTLNGNLTYEGVTDTDGERYNHITQIDGWQERQTLLYAEIPLALRMNIPLNGRSRSLSSNQSVSLIGEISVAYCLPISMNYEASGTIKQTGYYEPWHLTLHDIDEAGFYTENKFSPSGKLPSYKFFNIGAKLGVAVSLTKRVQLTAQAAFHYSVKQVTSAEGMGLLGFRNDREGQEQTHYFMSEYTTLAQTNLLQGKPKLMNIGLEIGVRFLLQHSKHSKYPCRCWID